MISVIDYGSGNLHAICTLLKLSNEDHQIIDRPEQIASASKMLLPGVGAFDRTMAAFNESGMADAIKLRMKSGNAMCMGICIGMHVLADSSEEGNTPGLGLIAGKVKRFDAARIASKPKTPHMGWNSISTATGHPLLANIDKERGFYFLHSYHFECADKANVIGTSDHGYEFHSVIGGDGVYGVQFHPEKSHANGVQLIKNFIAL